MVAVFAACKMNGTGRVLVPPAGPFMPRSQGGRNMPRHLNAPAGGFKQERTCRHCNQPFVAAGKSHQRRYCGDGCRKKAIREAERANGESIRDKARARYEANKKAIRERKAKYREQNRERYREAAKKYRQRHPEYRERNNRYRRANYRGALCLPVARYEEMLKTQGGLCAVCFRDRELVIDHCHSTGRVRGLLCRRCNLLTQDIEIVRAVLVYMEGHAEK